MRSVTLLVLAGLLVVFGVTAAFVLTGGGAPDGTLAERWTSDTARNNTINHHAVGAGPDGAVVVAPVATIAADNSRLSPTSCTLARLAPRGGAVRWRTTTPPADCFMHALTEPVITDVDGDGSVEVVAATIQNATVVHGADGSLEAEIPLSTYGYGRPTVADLTPAPGPEIVTSDVNGHVVVASGDGTVHWTVSLNETTWASPAVADVDGDGDREVVVGTYDRTVALNADGSRAWTTRVPGQDLVVGQADTDPAAEVFVTSRTAVTALDGQDGSVLWEQSVEGGPVLSHDAVADGDGDGQAELYVGQPKNRVLALAAATGEREWTTRLGPETNTVTPPPVVADLTGDGTLELATVTNGGTVTVLDPAAGTQLAVYERDVPIWTFPTAADITTDPGAELLVRYGDGRVVALAYTESS